MITKELQEWGRRTAAMVIAPLAASRVTPNMLTVVGLLLSLFTAAVIASGHITIGGLLLLFAGIFDMFDGALARVTGKSSTFGAFFDSTLDRIAEGAIGLGILWYYTAVAVPPNKVATALLYLVIVGSLMISYARARAEGLDLECKVGLMARPERVILLSIGLILGPNVTPWVLLILAATAWLTVVQRILHVWHETDGANRDDPAAPRVSPFRRKRVAS